MGEVMAPRSLTPTVTRLVLSRRARGLYESVFPTENGPASVQQDTPAQT